MKKILAVLLATIMMFSVALIPASAADAATAETEVTFDLEKFESDVIALFDYVEELIASIHNLVGDIMSVLDKECALCGDLHVIEDAPAAEEAVA